MGSHSAYPSAGPSVFSCLHASGAQAFRVGLESTPLPPALRPPEGHPQLLGLQLADGTRWNFSGCLSCKLLPPHVILCASLLVLLFGRTLTALPVPHPTPPRPQNRKDPSLLCFQHFLAASSSLQERLPTSTSSRPSFPLPRHPLTWPLPRQAMPLPGAPSVCAAVSLTQNAGPTHPPWGAPETCTGSRPALQPAGSSRL